MCIYFLFSLSHGASYKHKGFSALTPVPRHPLLSSPLRPSAHSAHAHWPEDALLAGLARGTAEWRQWLQFTSPAPRGNLSCLVLAYASALTCAPNWVRPKKSKRMTPLRERAFTPRTGCFGRGGSRQEDKLENPATLVPEAGPEAEVPMGELPNSWHHIPKGVWQAGTARKPPSLCMSLGPSFQRPNPYIWC